MDLSVVVVNWNGAHLLPGCLDPLADSGAEVIVVDNGSSDGSVELVRRAYPDVVLIANDGNRGFAAANNQGIAVATRRHVLLLNNDTVPDVAALEALVAFLDGHPQAAIAGPTLVYPDGLPQPSCGPGPNLWTELLGKTMLHRVLPGLRAWAPDSDRPVDWVTGAALAIRRDVARELGGLDEGTFLFYEDLDLCARVRETGGQVWFVATPPIVHIGGATRRRVETETLVTSYRSTDRYFARHGPAWRRQAVRWLTVPEMLLRSALWLAAGARPASRALARERLAAYRRILALAVGGSDRR